MVAESNTIHTVKTLDYLLPFLETFFSGESLSPYELKNVACVDGIGAFGDSGEVVFKSTNG